MAQLHRLIALAALTAVGPGCKWWRRRHPVPHRAAVWRSVRLGRFDVIVATSPQFFCAVAGWLAHVVNRTPWVF